MFELFIQIVLLLHVVLLPLYLYLTWNFSYWRKRGVRTALPLTIFGSFPSIVTRNRNLVYEIHNIYNKYKQRQRAVGVFVTRHPELVILDPQLAQEILAAQFDAYQATVASEWLSGPRKYDSKHVAVPALLKLQRGRLDKFMRYSAFWCARERWRSVRGITTNGLVECKLENAMCIWQHNCRKLTKFLDLQVALNTADIEIKDPLKRYTLHVLCQYLWGIDVDTITHAYKPDELLQILNKNSKHLHELRLFSLISALSPLLRKLVLFRNRDDLFTLLTRKALAQQNLSAFASHENSNSFLHYLLKLRHNEVMSEEAITGHLIAILLDGYESINTTLLYTFFYLAKNLTAQQKLRTEILNAKATFGQVAYAQLMSLPYLDQCVYETLRLNTPTPYYRRICTSATNMKLSTMKSIMLEPGMSVLIPAYSYHHDERYFANANLFKPERFDNEAHKLFMEQGVFLPFGAGPRSCLGMELSLLTIKSVLFAVISQYVFKSCALTQQNNNKGVTAFMLNLNKNLILKFEKL